MSGDHQPPPRVAPKVKAAPRIRQIYWCRLPTDAELPELWKIRPVIIISYRNRLYGAVTMIPTTTVAQDSDPWASSYIHRLQPIGLFHASPKSNQVLARVLECCQSCRDLALEFGTFAPILTALTAASGSSGVSAALFGALKGSPNGDLFLIPPLLEKSRFLSGTPNLRLTSRCQGRGLDRGRRRRRRSPSGSYNAPSRGHGRRKASWSEARCA